MSLEREIDAILSITLWKFDGLPNEIITPLNKLLDANPPSLLLDAMDSLIAPYKEDEKIARAYRGNSGYAGELHTATEMKIEYLNESIEYVKNRQNQ